MLRPFQRDNPCTKLQVASEDKGIRTLGSHSEVYREHEKMTNPLHRLLYIAFNFPPLAGPSPRHNLSTVRGLLTHGFPPTLVTAPEVFHYYLPLQNKLPRDEYLRSKIPEEITIIPCPWPFQDHGVLRLILSALRFPQLPYFFKRGQNCIYQVAQQELQASNYELIYSVNGIGIEHSAALRLKRDSGLPWVAEFRDPWIHNAWEWEAVKKASWGWWYFRQFKKVRQLLHQIVDNADLLVVESPMHGELLARDFNLDEQKVVPLGMGYEEDYFHDLEKEIRTFPKQPAIGFVGQTYGYQYAIKSLVEALKMLELQGYEFTLVTVGPGTDFQRLANEAKLRQFVPMGNVDHLQALSIMNELDYGIVATCEQCLPNINSKLWEYLALNLSVLAIAPGTGSMTQIVEAGDCGSVLSYDKTQMFLQLRTVLDDYKAGRIRHASLDFVMNYSRSTMVKRLAKRMEELL